MADKKAETQMNKKKKKQGQAATLKKVFRHLGKYRIFVVFSILLATISVALTLYVPKLTGNVVDYIIGAGQVDFPGVFRVMIQIGVCTLITALAQWLMNICNNKMTYQVVQDIRNEAFRKIEILPLKYIDGHPYGEVVSRVIADVDQFADGLLIYPAFYRNCHDRRDILFYAVGKCDDHVCSCTDHTGLILCSKFYSKENLFHVPAPV